MKKKIILIVCGVVLVILVYYGWKIYSFGNTVKNFGESFVESLTSQPLVKQEIYSPDSLLKLGVYRFIIPGDNGFEATKYMVSLIDTSLTFPKSGNILNEVEFEPRISWIKIDTAQVTLDSASFDFNTYSTIREGVNILITRKE
jgi:hypothetical protein